MLARKVKWLVQNHSGSDDNEGGLTRYGTKPFTSIASFCAPSSPTGEGTSDGQESRAGFLMRMQCWLHAPASGPKGGPSTPEARAIQTGSLHHGEKNGHRLPPSRQGSGLGKAGESQGSLAKGETGTGWQRNRQSHHAASYSDCAPPTPIPSAATRQEQG